MMVAAWVPYCRLRVMVPPSCVDVAVVLLFSISPFEGTLNWLYRFTLTPPAVGGATCTKVTPLAVASIKGVWPVGALGAATTAAGVGEALTGTGTGVAALSAWADAGSTTSVDCRPKIRLINAAVRRNHGLLRRESLVPCSVGVSSVRWSPRSHP